MSSHGGATASEAQRLDDLFARISLGIMFVLLAFGALSFLIHAFPRFGLTSPPGVENAGGVNGAAQGQ